MSKVLKEACDVTAPRAKNRRGKPETYWWNEELALARTEVISLRRRWKRSLRRKQIEENETAEHQRKYNVAKKKLGKLIAKAKATAWQELIDTIEQDPWGLPFRIVLNKLRRSRSSPTITETIDYGLAVRMVRELFPHGDNPRRNLNRTEWEDERTEDMGRNDGSIQEETAR